MKRYFSVVFIVIALSAISCSSSHSPTGSGSGSFSLNGPIILSEINANGPLAFAEIADQNGAINNATVTLTTAGPTTFGLGFVLSSSYPVTYSGGITILSMSYYDNPSITYTANQPYTMTVGIGSSTYTSSVMAVSIPTFTSYSSSVTCNWSGGGNENTIIAVETASPYNSRIFGPNITSPYGIPNSSLSGYIAGNYDLTASIVNIDNGAFSGTSSSSYLIATSEAITTH